MTKNLASVFVILVFIAILHFSSVAFGWYAMGLEVDSVQHFIAGIMFALLWLEFIRRSKKTEIPTNTAIFHFSMLGFVTLGAVIWEIWEFLASEIAPVFAENYKFYSPTISDLLKDIICSQIGVILVSLYLIHSNKNSKKLQK